MPLPRIVISLLRLTVPRHRVDTVLTDLEFEYGQTTHRSAVWLTKEVASLVTSYLGARLTAMPRVLPLLMRDCRLVLRGMRRGAGALVAASILLAVGIAAVLLTAALTEALLLRHVSSRYGEALLRIAATDRTGRTTTRFSFPELQAIRHHLEGLAPLTGVYLQPVALRSNNTDIQTLAEIVDGQYFELTGMTALIGRTLLAVDDRVDAPAAAVLAEPFWRRHFNASPSVLGGVVRLNGATYTVVGVAAGHSSRAFFGGSVDAWVTIAQADPLMNAGWRANVQERWFTAFFLAPDDSAAAMTRLSVAASDLGRIYPDPWRDRQLHAAPATVMAGSQRTAAAMLAVVLSALAALILAAAAANVGGLLIARAEASHRAAAIHIAVGAGRTALVRRQLFEGVLIGLASGCLALAGYAWLRVKLAELSVLPTLAIRLDLRWTGELIAIAIGGGAMVGLLLALWPALRCTRVDLAEALRDGDARSGTSRRTARLRRTLVSAQVCVSVVLIAGAISLARSLDTLTHIDLGFERDQLVAMDFDLEPRANDRAALTVMAHEALQRVAALPQIAAAAMSNRAPVDQSTPTIAVQRVADASSRVDDVTLYLATENYFATVGVPLLSGRSFTAQETSSAADVAIVNQSLAARLWEDADAIDRRIYLPGEEKTLRVIGVARDAKYRTLTESARPHIYRPTPPSLGLTLLARTRDDPRAALRAMQRELDQVGPGIVGFFPRTLEDHLAVQLLPVRAAATAATVLGVVALTLSAVALYALIAWFVLLRRREIGVRIALGASSRDVARLVVGQAVSAAIPGLIAGVGLGCALNVVAGAVLSELHATDPAAFAISIGVLLVIVLVASSLPSRAATLVDPVEALRR